MASADPRWIGLAYAHYYFSAHHQDTSHLCILPQYPTSSLGKRISIVNRGVRRSRRSFLVRKVFCFQYRRFSNYLIEVIKVKTTGLPPLQ